MVNNVILRSNAQKLFFCHVMVLLVLLHLPTHSTLHQMLLQYREINLFSGR